MQVLISTGTTNLVVSLMSNVSITGSYVSAKQAAIDRLEKIVNKSLIKNVPATTSLNQIAVAAANNVALSNASISSAVAAKTTISFGGTNTQAKLSVNSPVSAASISKGSAINNIASNVSIAANNEPVNKPLVNNNLVNKLVVKVGDASIVAAQPIQNAAVGVFAAPVVIDNNIRNYNDVIKYFKSAGYFVTGITTSKLQSLVTSFVDVKPTEVTSVVQKVGVYDVQSVALNTNLQQVQRATQSTAAVSAIASMAAQSTAASVFSSNVANPRAVIQNQAIVNNAAAEAVTSKVIVTDATVVDKTHKRILIPGTGVVGMILSYGNVSEYVLYLDTPNPIKYIDFPDGKTIFIYKRSEDQIDNTGNMILYPGLIEEPKIISEVFIDRGANNAFEPVKRLKNVKSLNELTKLGLGFYKINTKGFNFKNL